MYYNREGKTMIKVRETRVGTLYRSTSIFMKDYGVGYHQILVPVHLTTIQEHLPPFIFKKREDETNK